MKSFKEELLELLENDEKGICIDEITDTLYENHSVCIAEELEEEYPQMCGEDADCYECWKNRIEKLTENQ